MRQLTIYNIKIKIISIQLNTLSHQLLQMHMLIGQKLLDCKHVHLQQGLLQQNITLHNEIDQRDIRVNDRITIVLKQDGDGNDNNEQIGRLQISLQQFTNMKKRKLVVGDNKAYIQAFLLLIPTKIVDMPPQQCHANLFVAHESQVKSFNSKIEIIIQQSRPDEYQQQVTFNNNYNKQQTYSQIQQSQDINYDSLITLNQILNESNKQLEQKNRHLQYKILQLSLNEFTINKSNIQLQEQNVRIKQQVRELLINQLKFKQIHKDFQERIEMLESQLKNKQKQIQGKNDLCSKLRSENQKLNQQIIELNQMTKRQIRQELCISDIFNQLGKYKETSKKIKQKTCRQNKPIDHKYHQARVHDHKLTAIQIPKLTFAKSFFDAKSQRTTQRATYKTQRVGRQVEVKGSFQSRQLVKDDETLDTTSPQIKNKSNAVQHS